MPLTIRIDDRPDDYRPFFDPHWAERVEALAAGTRLAEPVFTLSVSWQAAANTCAMPWLVVHSLAVQWSERIDSRARLSARLAAAMGDRLAQEMGQLLSEAKRRKLAQLVRRIGQEAERDDERPARLDIGAVWRDLLADEEFQLALWGSQRIGYGSIYHAYEDFVRQCIAAAKEKPDYGGRRIGTLVRDATECFGRRIAQVCLMTQPVRIARLVRNALAHSGGRETQHLQGLPHGLAVEKGIVQVLAADTRALFDLLKRRAHRLVEAAAALPQVRAADSGSK